MNGNQSYGSHEHLQVTSQDIVFATLYSFIVFFGVMGNGIVITIVRKTPSMHTTTNYLLMNLAVADLLTLLLCPGVYDFALNHFRINSAMGDMVCKLFVGNAIVCITFDASVLTLCVIALERYVAIVKPFKSSSWNIQSKKTGIVIAFIWVLAVILTLPDSLWTEYRKEHTLGSSRYPCIRPWTLDHESTVKTYIITHCVILIVLPSILISFCYLSILKVLKWDLSDPVIDEADKSNMRRLLKLLVSLAVAFCILCLPFACFFLYVAALEKTQIEEDFASLFLAHRIVRVLIFFNSFINPLLYAAQSTNYRKALRDMICCRIAEGGASIEREVINLDKKSMTSVNGERLQPMGRCLQL